jgi:hypothetical protein
MMKRVLAIPLMLMVQASLVSSSSADQVTKQAIAAALSAERADPSFSHLSEGERVERVIQRVMKNTKRESAKTTATTSPNPTKNQQPQQKDETKSGLPHLALPPDTVVIVRKDFADIGMVSDPNLNSESAGATVSVSNDRVAKNVSWTLQGVGTVGYRFPLTAAQRDPSFRLDYGVVALYGGVDKFTNTAEKPDTPSKDNFIAGGLVEFGTTRGHAFDDYFRVRAGVVTDNLAEKTLYTIGDTKVTKREPQTSLSLAAEWMPVYTLGNFLDQDIGIHRGFSPFSFDGGDSQFYLRFDPELIIQYDNTFDQAKVLDLSYKSRAFRVGPQLGLIVVPFAHASSTLANVSVTTFYHPYHEFAAGHNSYSFQTNLNYNFTKELALTAGYTRGSDENTGKYANLFKVGLAGKLCSGFSC